MERKGPHGGRPCGGRENTVYTRSAGSWEQGRPHLLASIRIPQPEDRHLRRLSCSACGSLFRCPGRRTVPVPSLRGLGSGVSHATGSKRLGRSPPHCCTGRLEGKGPGQRGLGGAGGMLTGKEGGYRPRWDVTSGGQRLRLRRGRTAEVVESTEEDRERESRGLGQLRTCLILFPPMALWQRQGKALKFTANGRKKAPQQPDAPCPHCRLPRQGEQSRQFLLSGSAKSHDKRWCDLSGFPEWHNLPEGVFPLCTG